MIIKLILIAGLAIAAPNHQDSDQFAYQHQLIRSGRYLEAVDSLTAQINIYRKRENPDEAKMFAGACKLRADIKAFYLGKTDEALFDYNRAIFAAPESEAAAESHFRLGLVYFNRGKLKRSYREFIAFIKLSPKDPNARSARDYLGQILKTFRALSGKKSYAKKQTRPPEKSPPPPKEVVKKSAETTDKLAAPPEIEHEKKPTGETAPGVEKNSEQIARLTPPPTPKEAVAEPPPKPTSIKNKKVDSKKVKKKRRIKKPAPKFVITDWSIPLDEPPPTEADFALAIPLRNGELIGASLGAPPRLTKKIIDASVPIRVALAWRAKRVNVSSVGKFTLLDDSGRITGPITSAEIVADGEGFLYSGKSYQKLVAEPVEGSRMKHGGRSYRGRFEIVSDSGAVDLINTLLLDDYLYGVTPREVPSGWPVESLKAQAVAARTYALYQIEHNKNALFDLDATVMSQVYGGYDDEQPTTNAAVDQTSGEVMTYDEELIVAYFHSDSGGATETAGSVWGVDFPYLQSFNDDYSGPKPWRAEYTLREIENLLRKKNMPTGKISGIEISREAPSGRAVEITMVYNGGRLPIGANTFRIAIGAGRLKSTLFVMTTYGDRIIFIGRGFGHGVGMSQYGAKRMSERGADYREILNYYYRGIEIQKL